MVEDSPLSRSFLQSREQSNFFPKVVLAEASDPCDAVVDKVFVVGRFEVSSVLVDAVEAADESVVGEGNARGVDGERVVLFDRFIFRRQIWMDGVKDGVGMALPFLLRRLVL